MVAQGAGEFETVGFPQVLPSLFRVGAQHNGKAFAGACLADETGNSGHSVPLLNLGFTVPTEADVASSAKNRAPLAKGQFLPAS